MSYAFPRYRSPSHKYGAGSSYDYVYGNGRGYGPSPTRYGPDDGYAYGDWRYPDTTIIIEPPEPKP